MTMTHAIETRRFTVSIDALRAEFGAILADRMLEAEAADFLWNARVRERYLGQHIEIECTSLDPYQELSRVAFLSVLGDDWYAGLCVVDGEGAAVELLWKRSFAGRSEAEFAFLQAR